MTEDGRELFKYQKPDIEMNMELNEEYTKEKAADETPRIYIAADLHLNHANIILPSYCNRPFSNVEEMNETLVQNWNAIVRPKDSMYFLGDLAMGRRGTTDYWLPKLNGQITFIKGNHDRSKTIPFVDHAIIEHSGIPFYLVHHPYRIPKDWRDWAIHGHVHNNNVERYLFINMTTKRINASIEMTGYKPVALDDIVNLIVEGQNRPAENNT